MRNHAIFSFHVKNYGLLEQDRDSIKMVKFEPLQVRQYPYRSDPIVYWDEWLPEKGVYYVQ